MGLICRLFSLTEEAKECLFAGGVPKCCEVYSTTGFAGDAMRTTFRSDACGPQYHGQWGDSSVSTCLQGSEQKAHGHPPASGSFLRCMPVSSNASLMAHSTIVSPAASDNSL